MKTSWNNKQAHDRAWSETSDMMLVVACEKGEAPEIFAEATYRTARGVRQRIEELKTSGDYDRIKDRLDIHKNRSALIYGAAHAITVYNGDTEAQT
jgi:hypothetical protein